VDPVVLQEITRYHGGFNTAPTTIRTKDETASIERMRGSQLCRIHVYRYYGRAYINPRTYISAFGKRLEVRSYAPLPSDRSFVKFSDLFATPLPTPRYPTRFVELISVFDELLIRVQWYQSKISEPCLQVYIGHLT